MRCPPSPHLLSSFFLLFLVLRGVFAREKDANVKSKLFVLRLGLKQHKEEQDWLKLHVFYLTFSFSSSSSSFWSKGNWQEEALGKIRITNLYFYLQKKMKLSVFYVTPPLSLFSFSFSSFIRLKAINKSCISFPLPAFFFSSSTFS